MASILDDKLLTLRLAGHAEFQVRLEEFLLTYGINERPALVVQAKPAQGSNLTGIDLKDANVQTRFRAGVASDSGWWHGFQSMTAVIPTFHGIASLPTREKPNWAAEVHWDGHFIAGIWKFPVYSIQDKEVEALPDFYTDLFRDFLELVASTLKGASEQPLYEATCTLTHAPKLYYAGASMFGQRTLTGYPLQVPNLQWPISSAPVATAEWTQLAMRMGEALTGAYGDTPRPA